MERGFTIAKTTKDNVKHLFWNNSAPCSHTVYRSPIFFFFLFFFLAGFVWIKLFAQSVGFACDSTNLSPHSTMKSFVPALWFRSSPIQWLFCGTWKMSNLLGWYNHPMPVTMESGPSWNLLHACSQSKSPLSGRWAELRGLGGNSRSFLSALKDAGGSFATHPQLTLSSPPHEVTYRWVISTLSVSALCHHVTCNDTLPRLEI